MRILFVMPSHISYGGIESVAINLWKVFLEKGYYIDFVCHGYQEGIFESDITQRGTHIYHIPIKGKNYWGTINEFEKIIMNGSYDVVHSHMNATSGIYLRIAKKYDVKVLVSHSHMSAMNAFTKNPLKALVNQIEKKRTNKYSNIRIACSDNAGRWLFGNRHYNVILNAVDVSALSFSPTIRTKRRIDLKIEENEFVVIHVGGFFNCKNHLYLIKVFSEICKLKNNAKLILVGDGPLRKEINHKIKEFDLENNVFMLGQRNDVNELLQAADVFLLPSISEGNPVALAEAAVSGLHCLVSERVAKDIAKYFAPDSIEFLPIAGEDSVVKWAETAITPWKRIQYCKENPCELDIKNMAKRIESLYMTIINGETNE